MSEQGIVKAEAGVLTPADVIHQVDLIQQVMSSVMKEGEHYGTIPGCGSKPSLLKPGAEKLSLTFRLAPRFKVDERTLDGGHKEFYVECELHHIDSGKFIGMGVGFGSTMESKWRYRSDAAESTGHPVPREYWTDRDPAIIGGKGFTTVKVDGRWEIAIKGEKVENDNPADMYNTVLKMAKKRAHVDAVLSATAASDFFTQDIEDLAQAAEKYPAPALPTAEVKPEQAEDAPLVADEYVEPAKPEQTDAPDLHALASLTFGRGKHEGSALGHVVKTDLGYARYYIENGKDSTITDALKHLVAAWDKVKSAPTAEADPEPSGAWDNSEDLSAEAEWPETVPIGGTTADIIAELGAEEVQE